MYAGKVTLFWRFKFNNKSARGGLNGTMDGPMAATEAEREGERRPQCPPTATGTTGTVRTTICGERDFPGASGARSQAPRQARQVSRKCAELPKFLTSTASVFCKYISISRSSLEYLFGSACRLLTPCSPFPSHTLLSDAHWRRGGGRVTAIAVMLREIDMPRKAE